MGSFRMTPSFVRNNYQDLLVSTEEIGECVMVQPRKLSYEYILTDFTNNEVSFTIPEGCVSIMQILNFPLLSDVAVSKIGEDNRTVYIDLRETDQLLVSNNKKISMILDLSNDPIIVMKSSHQLDFE